MSSSTPSIQQNGNPTMQAMPNGKSSAAPPQSSTDGVELKNMTTTAGGQPPLPIESDIMQLARLGEIGAMQKLFDTKKFNAKYQDEEGITPLHVSFPDLLFRLGEMSLFVSLCLITLFSLRSGLRSITSMRCVGSSSTPEPTLTPRAANP